MDREKVIKDNTIRGLQSAIEISSAFVHLRKEHAKAILALLKEQEAVKRTYRTGVNGFSIIWTCGACGSDLHPNNAKAKYCSNCGQAVKWDD